LQRKNVLLPRRKKEEKRKEKRGNGMSLSLIAGD
jgi:hypothetical protein